jgi:Zn-dependent metalloprotease
VLMNSTNLGIRVNSHRNNNLTKGHRNYAECYFLPPVIIRKQIEEAKTPELRRKAMRNLEVSSALRRERRIKNTMYGMFMSVGAEKQRSIHDMMHSWNYDKLPGKLIRSEGHPDISGDNDANNAYENSGHTFDFYKEVFQRISIDNNGMPLHSSVRMGEDWDNAQWTGQYMIYGEGGGGFLKKGKLTNLVVCAHELTHGVTENESNLAYEDEMGGLNEGLSDIFGVMCDQWVKKQKVDEASWLVGEGIVENGDALRSMKEPGTGFPGDPQINNYKDFDPSMDPHVCSGVPNKAFYLTCMEIGGYSWEKAGKIWYIALKDTVKEDTKFLDLANSTFTIAGQMFGDDVQKAVRKGWEGVGVTPKPLTIANVMRVRAKFA